MRRADAEVSLKKALQFTAPSVRDDLELAWHGRPPAPPGRPTPTPEAYSDAALNVGSGSVTNSGGSVTTLPMLFAPHRPCSPMHFAPSCTGPIISARGSEPHLGSERLLEQV